MIKKLIVLLAAAVVCFAGCAENTAVSGGYTFTDDFGRTVTVTSHERTAVLLGSFADVWTLAGGEICASAADAWEDFDLALPETTVNLGSLKTLGLEGLLAAEPDFVIAGTRSHRDAAWLETLDAAGITAAYFDVLSFDDYLRMLKICTDITGREDLYEKYGTDVRETVGKTVAAAESCTAGMFCSRIGDIPGASDILLGGVVSYANEVKENILGVPGEILRTVGAVSEPCAAKMAEGVRRITGADITVSVTGIAGPGGGTPDKPVGTVCFGLADEKGTVTETVHFGYKSDRAKIRRLTVARAMMNVIRRLEEQ